MYQAFHYLREETLTPWDAKINTGIPDEAIKCYNDMNNPNDIMTKRNFAKFNNPLTKQESGAIQAYNFVLYPSNGSQ